MISHAAQILDFPIKKIGGGPVDYNNPAKHGVAAGLAKKQLSTIFEKKKKMRPVLENTETSSPSSNANVVISFAQGLALNAGVSLINPAFLPLSKLVSGLHTGNEMRKTLNAKNDPVFVQDSASKTPPLSFAEEISPVGEKASTPHLKMKGLLYQAEHALKGQLSHNNGKTLQVRKESLEYLGHIPSHPVLKLVA